MNKPELVAPGGGYTKAMVAGVYGADAVYVGVPFTSLRMRQNKLQTFQELKKTIADLHSMQKKAYLTMNIFPKNQDIKTFEKVVEQIADVGADAIIFSDPGTFRILRKYLPDIDLHLSTQTSILNYEAVQFWHELGVKRIILARELHISEIAQIKEKVPSVELEVFAHGAMCMSYSGRCLLGEYFSGRDANKGECSHVCRYKFRYFAQEEKRPDKLYEVEQDEQGSYIFSSKDLSTISYLNQIMPYVDGLKIEGRSKGEFYLGPVVKAYRHAIDTISLGKKPDPEITGLVDMIPHRPYWAGFIVNERKDYPEKESSINFSHAGPVIDKVYYGLILPNKIIFQEQEYHQVIVKQNIDIGQKLNFISPDNNGILTIKAILDSDQKPIQRANCNMDEVYIHFDKQVDERTILYD